MNIDFGKTAEDYKQHRQGFPPRFFDRLYELNVIGSGKHVLDIGTGTGTLARGMALAGSDVIGVDISEPLMEQAKLLDKQAGVAIQYHTAPAENIPLPDESFDTVTAGQCWHWFDRPRAAAEVKRLLKAGGAVVITHLDWVPLAGNVVDITEKLMLKHNPNWTMSGGTGLYPAWLGDLALAGFENIETFSFDIHLHYTPQAWRGRIRASAAIAASLTPEAVTQFDGELENLLEEQFPGDFLAVPHRVWAVIAHKPE